MGIFDIFNRPHRKDTTTTTETIKQAESSVVIKPKEYEDEELHYVAPMDLMDVKFSETPNKSVRRGDIRYIVLHHTGPGSFNGIVNWLTDKRAQASAHYVVGKNAQVAQLANTKRYETWHAGVARWHGERINNHHSIGIEICNHGILEREGDCYYYETGRSLKKYKGKTEPQRGSITYPDGSTVEGHYVPYPQKQINKVVALCKGLVEKYPHIGPEDIITHYEIAVPYGRKNDPFGLDVELIRKLVFYGG